MEFTDIKLESYPKTLFFFEIVSPPHPPPLEVGRAQSERHDLSIDHVISTMQIKLMFFLLLLRLEIRRARRDLRKERKKKS